MLTLKYIAKVSFAAMLAIGLAACGGGSDQTDDQTDEMSQPDPALVAAQDAAMTAATEAGTAAGAAEDAVMAQTGNQAADQASYDMANQAAMNARAAATAAQMASNAAAMTNDVAEARAHQATAEAQKAIADRANTDAMMYAGMVQAAQDAIDNPDPSLVAARGAAMTAATEADAAADAAEAAVMAQMDNQAADQASYDMANQAAMNARAAATAAQMASNAAAMTNDVAEARAHQATAEAQKAIADRANTDAMMYAGMVQTAQDDADEAQRMLDVAAARSAAMRSYMDADADATMAEAAADAAEATAPGSPGAMAAREAATAARTAANAAMMAHGAIMDGMTKAEADAQAADAATQAGMANSYYMTAKMENDDIQTADATLKEQQRVRDIADAKEAAKDAYMEAMAAKDEAEAAAMDAEQARDDAMVAYMQAMAARTDMDTAKMEYEEAKAAAMMAREAATDAMNAYMAAKMAADGIMDDGTAEAAEMARMTAETERDKAQTAARTADTQKTAAENAEGEAMMAAGMHVLGLLKAANAVEVKKDVAMAIGNAAGAGTGDADNNSSTTNGGSDSTATAAWPANTPANPDATPPTDEVGMSLTITVTRTGGTDLVFRTMAAEEDDTGTTEVDETIVTATKIDGLTGFMQGYSISDRGTHSIVFTDKDQDDAPTTAADPVTARVLTNFSLGSAGSPVGSVTELGTPSGNGFTGVEYSPASGEAPLMGSLMCPADTACSAITDDDDTITAYGYVFTGSRAAKDAVTEMTAAQQAAANDYLVFGVWLDGDDNANNDGTGDPQIAAFANGGRNFTTPVALYGTATYRGSATGVYTAGESVDYFQGRASLTANFGDTPDQGVTDSAAGTVTGMIDEIMVGGVDMPDDMISLNTDITPADGNITPTGGFAGNARMGDPMVNGDVVTYTYTGTWNGQFHGAPAATDAVNTTVPGSAAGTFGVTGTMGEGDDAMTRSYVGAFGANCSDCD